MSSPKIKNFAYKTFRLSENRGYHALLIQTDDDGSLEKFTQGSKPFSD